MNNAAEQRLRKVQSVYVVRFAIVFASFALFAFVYFAGLISELHLGPVTISGWTVARFLFPVFLVVIGFLTFSYYAERAKLTRRPLTARR